MVGEMDYSDFVKVRGEVTQNFCDTAKTYIQLASAGLAPTSRVYAGIAWEGRC